MTHQRGRAVIFGGLGFIGTNLALRLIDSGWAVTLVDPVAPQKMGIAERVQALSGRARIIHGGMEQHALVEGAISNAHIAFDLAGATGHLESMQNPLSDVHANLTVHVAYLELASRVRPDLPVVLASTRQVLGSHGDELLTDSTPTHPVDANGVSKVALESYLRVFGASWGLSSVVLRLPNVYGPHMRVFDSANGVIGGWVGQALRKSSVTIYGSGTAMRNVLFVEDAAEALMAGMDLVNSTCPSFLVGGDVISLREIASTIAHLTDAEIFLEDMPPDLASIAVESAVVDDSAFRSRSGWRPRVAFDEGIRESLRFYRERQSLYAR
jgi:UDP-glucose 4-epimerase